MRRCKFGCWVQEKPILFAREHGDKFHEVVEVQGALEGACDQSYLEHAGEGIEVWTMPSLTGPRVISICGWLHFA